MKEYTLEEAQNSEVLIKKLIKEVDLSDREKLREVVELLLSTMINLKSRIKIEIKNHNRLKKVIVFTCKYIYFLFKEGLKEDSEEYLLAINRYLSELDYNLDALDQLSGYLVEAYYYKEHELDLELLCDIFFKILKLTLTNQIIKDDAYKTFEMNLNNISYINNKIVDDTLVQTNELEVELKKIKKKN